MFAKCLFKARTHRDSTHIQQFSCIHSWTRLCIYTDQQRDFSSRYYTSSTYYYQILSVMAKSLLFSIALFSAALMISEAAPLRFNWPLPSPYNPGPLGKAQQNEAQKRYEDLFGKPIDINQFLSNFPRQENKASQQQTSSLSDLVNELNRISQKFQQPYAPVKLDDTAAIEAFMQLSDEAKEQIWPSIVGGAVSGAVGSLTNRAIDRFG